MNLPKPNKIAVGQRWQTTGIYSTIWTVTKIDKINVSISNEKGLTTYTTIDDLLHETYWHYLGPSDNAPPEPAGAATGASPKPVGVWDAATEELRARRDDTDIGYAIRQPPEPDGDYRRDPETGRWSYVRRNRYP
jgi:hypothetical protein